MKLLLDTHTFLWMANEKHKLSSVASAVLENENHQLVISSISAWEIGQKYYGGKLRLPMTPSAFITEMCTAYGIDRISFSFIDCMHLAKLPTIHRDPFDRMLICQAIEHGLTIVTNDRAIMAYPIKTLW